MKAVVFEVSREGYGIDQVEAGAMTVGELKDMLEDLDDDVIVIMSHDNGYTYGSLPRCADVRESEEGKYGTEYKSVDEVWY